MEREVGVRALAFSVAIVQHANVCARLGVAGMRSGMLRLQSIPCFLCDRCTFDKLELVGRDEDRGRANSFVDATQGVSVDAGHLCSRGSIE